MKLKVYRAMKEITQEQLAELCGVSRATIIRAEKGMGRNVSFGTAKKIEKATGIKWDELCEEANDGIVDSQRSFQGA